MTLEEASILLQQLKKIFDIVRLVDVAVMNPYTLDTAGQIEAGDHLCHAVWHKSQRCENCISSRALAQKTRLTKFEFMEDEIYHVVAKYVEINEKPYVLEIVSIVTDTVLFSAFGKEHLVDTIQRHNSRLYTDRLTGAYNREYYEEQMQALQQNYALAMVDVDNFKQINDTYGHHAGDLALRTIVELFRSNMRSVDAVIRYGGDEFLLLFQNLAGVDLYNKLVSLCQLVEQARVDEYPDLRLTVSIGSSDMYDTVADRVRGADQRLYRAKIHKNTVCCQ